MRSGAARATEPCRTAQAAATGHPCSAAAAGHLPPHESWFDAVVAASYRDLLLLLSEPKHALGLRKGCEVAIQVSAAVQPAPKKPLGTAPPTNNNGNNINVVGDN